MSEPTAYGPHFLFVHGDTEDPAKMRAYAQALAGSALYPRHEGRYVAFGKPAALLEGAWPESRNLVLARFPSRAQAERFWHSEAYQAEVKPLRAGAGRFDVGLFPELPPLAPAGALSAEALTGLAVDGYFGNVAAQNLDALMAVFGPDPVMTIHSDGIEHRGRAAIAAHFRAFFADFQARFGDFEPVADAARQKVAVRFRLKLENGRARRDMHNLNLFTVADGRIARCVIYMSGSGVFAGG